MVKKVKEIAFPTRTLILPGGVNATIKYAAEEWIRCAQEAIDDHGFFAVALSGGSTPLLIYRKLTSKEYQGSIAWDKIYFFWSDERAVPPNHPDSNYHMAMEAGGLIHMPIKKEQIHRMRAEENIEAHAMEYQNTLQTLLGNRALDLVMLGLGEDGHTASLFPHTTALHADKLVVANEVPQKKCWRMTFTFSLINKARHIVLYAMGSSKAEILKQLLHSHENGDALPAKRLGSTLNKAQFIVDDEAGRNLLNLTP